MLKIKSESTGADGVPLKFIKLVFPIIADQMVHIFNAIITSSTFPLQWKIGKVIPIPKTKNPRTLSDYRPISVLSTMSKILEIIMRGKMQDHLDMGNYISPCQSGFRKGRPLMWLIELEAI